MQFKAFALLASALAVPTAWAQPPVRSVLNYDTRFDDPKGPLSSTTCSADAGVLHGLHNFGDIPNFPYIAGSFLIEGFNSTRCGACYELTYNRPDGTQTIIPFTIINSADRGFISSLKGLEDLTGLTRNTFLGDAPILYREVPSRSCRF